MGLLDGFSEFAKTPEGQGLLAATFGGLAGARRGAPINSLGRAGLAGLSGYGNAQDRDLQAARAEQQRKYQEQVMAHTQMQMDAVKRQQTDEQEMRDLAKAATLTPEQARARSMGPTLDGGPVPEIKPGFNNEQYIQGLFAAGKPMQAMQWQQATKPKEPEAFTLGKGQVRYLGDKVVATGPEDIEKEPEAIRQLKAIYGDGTPQFKAAMQQYGRKMTTHQPSTVVNTGDSLGLKPKDRFDMEDKMRNDYSTATKNDSEIIGTAQDLKNILKQGGALKDQAAIYKFAKSLDPQGAVREADYAAIVKTAGGLDYVTAIVNKALTGEQLSPNQRKEMASLMDAMASVAQQRVAKVQKRYGANAKMYNLKPENIFQQQSESEDGWGIAPGGKQ